MYDGRVLSKADEDAIVLLGSVLNLNDDHV